MRSCRQLRGGCSRSDPARAPLQKRKRVKPQRRRRRHDPTSPALSAALM